MKIRNGLHDGMVMQRDTATGACDSLLALECEGEPTATCDGKAVHLERDGEGWRLTGIPVGGPYTLTLCDKNEKVSFTDVKSYCKISYIYFGT